MTLLEQFDWLVDPTRSGWFGSGLTRAFLPPADLIVDQDEVTVVMDVPGLKADSLDVELTGDVLTVTGERAYPYGTAGSNGAREGSWHRLERSFGKFQRVLQMPKGLDPEQITATIADGVLTLRIPQPAHRKPRRIEITTASGPSVAGGGQAAIETSASSEMPGEAAPATEEREVAGATA